MIKVLERKSFKERLIERGWSEAEAQHAHNIVSDPDRQQKHLPMKQDMSLILYWMVLTVLTVCNFLIAVVLIPFLLVLTPLQVIFIVLVLGLVFGLLFNLLIFDIEHVELKHHYAAAVFIPAMAILTMYLMTSVANKFAVRIQSGGHESPFIIGLVYVVSFLGPYGVSLIKLYLRKKQEKQTVMVRPG